MSDLVLHPVERGRVQGTILECTRCPLSEHVRRPVAFRGPTPNRLMIVGDAPAWQDNRDGRPFAGDSGRVLARALHDTGMPPLDSWFIANTVCCYSPDAPDDQAQRACRTNLRAQIKLCDPSYVLLLGAIALKSTEWCGEKITRVHGRPFVCDGGPYIGRTVLPTFHPAVGLRDEKKLTELRADLTTFRDVIGGKLSIDVIGVRIGRKGKIAA